MPATMRIALADGNTILIGPPPAQSGLREVSRPGDIPARAADQFEKALGALGSVVALLQAKVDALVERPKKVEIEFGASLEGECDLWIVSGKGEAAFKVTLTWE